MLPFTFWEVSRPLLSLLVQSISFAPHSIICECVYVLPLFRSHLSLKIHLLGIQFSQQESHHILLQILLGLL